MEQKLQDLLIQATMNHDASSYAHKNTIEILQKMETSINYQKGIIILLLVGICIGIAILWNQHKIKKQLKRLLEDKKKPND